MAKLSAPFARPEQTETCDCCKGWMPLEGTPEWQHGDGECRGHVGPEGECLAFATRPAEDYLAEVEALHADAAGGWSEADWTHEFIGEGSDSEPEPTYCTGDCEGCTVCASAKEDAAEAEEWAEKALDLAREGRWSEAEGAARAAYGLEVKWGDAPVWGGFFRAVEAAAKAVR